MTTKIGPLLCLLNFLPIFRFPCLPIPPFPPFLIFISVVIVRCQIVLSNRSRPLLCPNPLLLSYPFPSQILHEPRPVVVIIVAVLPFPELRTLLPSLHSCIPSQPLSSVVPCVHLRDPVVVFLFLVVVIVIVLAVSFCFHCCSVVVVFRVW